MTAVLWGDTPVVWAGEPVEWDDTPIAPSYPLPFDDDPIAAAWLGEAEDLVRHVDRLVGSQDRIAALVDPDRTPTAWLPWLAQIAGVRVEDQDGEQAVRRRLLEAPQRTRGTVAALRAAARQYMTGARTVQVDEQTDANGDPHPDWVRVRIYSDEAPRRWEVRRALALAKPADVALAVEFIDGETYGVLADEFTTYADLTEAFASYDEMRIWRPTDG